MCCQVGQHGGVVNDVHTRESLCPAGDHDFLIGKHDTLEHSRFASLSRDLTTSWQYEMYIVPYMGEYRLGRLTAT